MEENQVVRVDKSIQNSILTTSQRKFLQANIQNTSRATTTRKRIRERVKEGIRDFRILSDCLEARDRKEIFGTNDYGAHVDLQKDVTGTVAFMYAGLDGEAGFRNPLIDGVQIGEANIRGLDTKFNIEPRFTVDYLSHVDKQQAVEAVKQKKWDQISSRSLFEFIRLADSANAIDFEKIDNVLAGMPLPQEMNDNSDQKTE